MDTTIIERAKTMPRSQGRLRTERCYHYSLMAAENEDEMDTVCLLAPSKPALRRTRRRKLKGFLTSIWKKCRGGSSHDDDSNKNIVHSSTAASSPVSSVPTKGRQSPTSIDPSQAHAVRDEAQSPMYFIISEVGSEAMREELEDTAVRNLSEQWNDENVDKESEGVRGACATRLGKFSLRRCFARCRSDGDDYFYDTKDLETIPMGDEALSMQNGEEYSLSSFSSDEPPPPPYNLSYSETISNLPGSASSPTRSFPRRGSYDRVPIRCFQDIQIEECSSSHSSFWQEEDGDNDHWIDEQSVDRRDDSNTNRQVYTSREHLQLLFPPPFMPFERSEKVEPLDRAVPLLGAAFPHPSATDVNEQEQLYPTLGIQSAHPHWAEREKTNIWEQVHDPGSFFMNDEPSTLPSPIQVESWTNSRWLRQPSNSMESVVEGFTPQKFDENTYPEGCRQKQSSPMEWTRKLYQPIFRFAKDITTTCGQLGDALSDEAPFDEVEDDMRCRTFNDITNTVYTRRKKASPRLKPNPKDSPTLAWFREVTMKGNPMWRDLNL